MNIYAHSMASELPRYNVKDTNKIKVIDTALAWDSYDKEFLRTMGQTKVRHAADWFEKGKELYEYVLTPKYTRRSSQFFSG